EEIVWSANREYPVGENAILNFTAAGDLVLKDGDGSIVWSTNTAGKSVVGMNLTDTGNLVLFDDHNSVVWQAFSHTAALSTSWNINYSDVQPILFREISGAQLFCSFLCEGYCSNDRKSNHYIFAIFFSPTTKNDNDTRKVVWSANRDHPVGTDAILNFTTDGELVLKDVNGRIVWTTNTAGKSVAGMNLTDTGNLVLFDHQNSVVWQSFDYLTDSLLPGQKLFTGQQLKSSISSTNSRFVYPFDNDNGIKRKRYIRLLNGSLSLFIHSSEPSGPDIAIEILPASSAQYMKLMPDGHLHVFEYQPDFSDWTVVSDITDDFVEACDYPLVCGRNSICSTNQQCICPGNEYFRPVNDRQPNLGCSEITHLTCNSTQHQQFITLENVTYFTPIADMVGNVTSAPLPH
ncbi:hypothetical protein M8C21_015374, partial [Ambrosia artemisiifolia]